MIDTKLLITDEKFRYTMLSRLQSDCKYYLNWGNKNKKRLWAGNVKDQIKIMKLLYKTFSKNKRPKWLTYKQIKEYEARMGK